ncbi:hypothetical protein LD110_06690 [Arthrobacter sp. M4]|nr:hypothetical protein [Arthrobacter sp. M4]
MPGGISSVFSTVQDQALYQVTSMPKGSPRDLSGEKQAWASLKVRSLM